MLKKTIEQRQAYHDRKAKELDEIADPHMYTRRLARIMKYHKLLSELESAKVKQKINGKNGGVIAMSKDKDSLVDVMDVALELDDEVNAIGYQAQLIEDITQELVELNDDMDNVHMEHLQYYFGQFHRKIRMLDILLSCVSKELGNHHQNAKYLKKVLHDMAVDDKRKNEKLGGQKK